MNISQREQQIIRIQSQSSYASINKALEATLRLEANRVTQIAVESALDEEVQAYLSELQGTRPRRSGYYQRVLDTQYGRIAQLSVPKLRKGNADREWKILERYQRALGSLLEFCLGLYVMGLSLRDLQEALYEILGAVLSVNAINRITLKAQKQMLQSRQTRLEKTPFILIVDGVWASVQCASEDFWEDQAGHIRKLRRAEDRVILVAMAIWPDGTQTVLHYEMAVQESEAAWLLFFEHLRHRGLQTHLVKLIVSDGTTGLPKVIRALFPLAQHQRCITHKVRAMLRHLGYEQLPHLDAQGQELSHSEAKKLRYSQIKHDAYAIYKAPDWEEAIVTLLVFAQKWTDLEPDAVRTFIKDFALTLSFYDFDESLHSLIRTSNALERLFRKFRTKADEIGAFPNEESCLAIFFLVSRRDHAKHDRLKNRGE
ncbi:transposase [Acaryochloris marina]|uniref:IS256 family transposase n=2 Tax=Acaryochloris marina TaxID=155978 RepID=UPI001BAE6DA4|nr:transposase [Acaryochloris marina]QUY40340.1 transposase [Acaryochloris marina S15]QUY40350.1 transposase [Acaryochloris marina S15]QUY40379.1 transposase [Acaryochloris marina S15]QUY43496.1 transposase [Acaryochloris marina S15]QUY43577.1 transposase [Acaryochloris marina S15]